MNSFPRNIQWKNYKINIILIHDKDATISRVCSVTFASRLTCSPLRAPWTTKPLCGTFYQLYAQEQCLVHPHRWRSDQKVNTEGLLISQFWYRSFCLCQHWLYTMNSSFWDKIIIITLVWVTIRYCINEALLPVIYLLEYFLRPLILYLGICCGPSNFSECYTLRHCRFVQSQHYVVMISVLA